MSKVRKYKKGDKVIITNGPFINSNLNNGDICEITKKLSDEHYNITSCNSMNRCNFEYEYDKPLTQLLCHLQNNDLKKNPIGMSTNTRIINSFVNMERTLLDNELKFCRELWDKELNKLKK